MPFLDEVGLNTFWKICKQRFGSKVDATKQQNVITLSLYGKEDTNTDGTDEDHLLTSTQLQLSTASVPTPVAGTAITADDITEWSAGSLPALSTATKSISPVTEFDSGQSPSLTITPTDVLSGYQVNPTTGSAGSMSVEDGVLSISFGTVVTGVSGSPTVSTIGSGSSWSPGSLPQLSLGEAVSIGSVEGWSAGALPALAYSEKAIPNISVSGSTSVITDISIPVSE